MRDQIAKELDVPVRFIEVVKVQDGLVEFTMNNVFYYAKVNKSCAKILKNSIRKDFS